MRHYALIGRSIENSLSPRIQAFLMSKLGVEGDYRLVPMSQFDVEYPIFLESDWDGFNVTIPFKQQIIPYLDALDDSAALSGAVNTVKKESRGWVGYNTDGTGFYQTIRHITDPDDRVLLMGTGGAAFGIASALAGHGYKDITIAGRQGASFAPLLQHLSEQFRLTVVGLTYAEVDARHFDVIINATSVGMTGADQTPLFDYHQLESRHLVVDIVYKPRWTPLLKAAQAKGAKVVGGLQMLLAQALYAQSLWQGKDLEWSGWKDELLTQMEEVLDGTEI